MLELVGQPSLEEEPIDEYWIGRSPHDLGRQFASDLLVADEEDFPHPAAAQAPRDLVATQAVRLPRGRIDRGTAFELDGLRPLGHARPAPVPRRGS